MRVIHSPAYTPEDSALLMALEVFEASLCDCGWPKSVAWHSEMDGWFESKSYLCHACTARAGRQVIYATAHNTWPEGRVLPEFVLGVTTTDG